MHLLRVDSGLSPLQSQRYVAHHADEHGRIVRLGSNVRSCDCWSHRYRYGLWSLVVLESGSALLLLLLETSKDEPVYHT